MTPFQVLAIIWISLAVHSTVNSQENGAITVYLPGIEHEATGVLDRLQRQLEISGIKSLQLKSTEFWHPYQNGIRTGRMGIYFAEPHLAAWLISKKAFTPLLRLHGETQYVLTTLKSKVSVFEVKDLNGSKICHERGLNLGRIWLNELLGNNQIEASLEVSTNIEKQVSQPL